MMQSKLKELFEYKEGVLYWKNKVWKTGLDRTGTIAGCKNGVGYGVVKINQKVWLIHRVIFLMHHGYLPEFIDHIDRNKLNNRIENLREVTYSQSSANRSRQKNNVSGFKGVWKRKNRPSWIVRVGIGKERKYLGSYRTPEEAYEVYKKAAKTIYGQYANV